MKKIISLLLVLSFVLCFAACGGNETPDENVNNNSVVDNADDNSDDNIITSSKEITLEDVENAPVSPATDFEIYEPDSGVVIIDGYIGNEEIVVIPETINGKTVTEIADGAFVNADTVRAVKLADTIEVVGENAFHAVDELEIIVTGSNLKRVEDFAFTDCPQLRCIELNDGIEYIGGCAIYSNPKLKEIYVPGTVKEIVSFALVDGMVICESGSVAESYCKDFAYNYKVK